MNKIALAFQIVMSVAGTAVFIYVFWSFYRDRKRWRQRDEALEKDMKELRARRDKLVSEVLGVRERSSSEEDDEKPTLH